MNNNFTIILIHSPLVGPLTWKLVGIELEMRGYEAILPVLSNLSSSGQPFWKQHADSVAQFLHPLPPNRKLILAAHSGAGPLIPAIRQSLKSPVDAYLFVDASIPRNRASRIDLMKTEDTAWAEQLHQALLRGEQFPNWNESDLEKIIPNPELRRQLVAEIRPQSLPFFTEPIPVFKGWPDAPCAYIKLSAPYNQAAAQARKAGWPVLKLNAAHFHMLVDPPAVAESLETAVQELFQNRDVK